MTELPRVLLCSFDVVPAPSGTSSRLTEGIRAVAPYFQVVALTLKTLDLTHIETFHGARLLRVPVGAGDLESQLQTFQRAVERQLESEEYALIHFTDPFSGQPLCEHRQPGSRLIYDAVAFPSSDLAQDLPATPENARFLARARRRELACLMTADAVLTGSPLTRTFLESVGVPTNAIHLMRTPAPATPRFTPPPAHTGLRLLYLGSVQAWQGLDTLLEALAKTRGRCSVKLQVVGPDHPEHTPRLKANAEALGLLEDTIQFLGPMRRDQLATVLAEADVGVLPLSPGDCNEVRGAPLTKVSDYLAAGRAVIAADLPASRALLTEDVAAFFPADQPTALADLLTQLASEPERIATLGANAQRFAEVTLSVDTFRNELRGLYCALLGIRDPATESRSPDEITHTQVEERLAPMLQRAERRWAGAPDEDRTAATHPRIPFPADDPSNGPIAPIPVSTIIEAPSPQEVGAPLDPWIAMVLHGYCPPPTTAFSRPLPPTSHPGPSLPATGTSRSRS